MGQKGSNRLCRCWQICKSKGGSSKKGRATVTISLIDPRMGIEGRRTERLWARRVLIGESDQRGEGSGAKFVSGLCAFEFLEISDQAASTAFHSSGIVAERPPNLPVLN
jgi:hypothetical protein